jgi:hypothetical protein
MSTASIDNKIKKFRYLLRHQGLRVRHEDYLAFGEPSVEVVHDDCRNQSLAQASR